MEIEVRFEGTSTVFRISDNPDIPPEPTKTLETTLSTLPKIIRKDSLTKRTTVNTTIHSTKSIIHHQPKTFVDLKKSVAPFFSLNPDDFFFAVNLKENTKRV